MLTLYYFLGVVALVFVYFTTIFIFAQKFKNNSIVDIFWGLGFVLISIYSLIFTHVTNFNGGLDIYKILISGFIILWGLRLFLYIGIRNFSKPEDFRYVNMRKNWGDNKPVLQAFFKVFMLQGFFMLLVSFPIYAAHLNKLEPNLLLNVLTIIGSALFIIGFFFEAIGDAQLRQFLKKRTGRDQIMQTGLWKYTRHPNYFGEVVMWWGHFIFVAGTTFGFIAVISPIIMTWLMLFVSGIPMLEKKYDNNPFFQEYKKRTSAFFPWLPKKTEIKVDKRL